MTKHAQAVLALSCLLSIFSCKDKDIDPCLELSSTTCNGLFTEDLGNYERITSPNVIFDVTVNPNNTDEIAFVGRPTGYSETMLFVMNVATGIMNPIAPSIENRRCIPDWGANGLILFPLGNNAIRPDGSSFGDIKGCPNITGLHPKWVDGGNKIAGFSNEIPDGFEFFVSDLRNRSLKKYGNYSEDFRVSIDGTKVLGQTHTPEITWMDLQSGTRHLISQGNGRVNRSADWLPDNKTIVWVDAYYEPNECGKSVPLSNVNLMDVTTQQMRVIATGCYWDNYLTVKASPDGNWLYVVKSHVEKTSDNRLITHFGLWRLSVDGSKEEFVVG